MQNLFKWMPLRQAADALGISKRTLYRWTKMEHPPVRIKKFGGQWRFYAPDINPEPQPEAAA